jgi:hypothetical protein
MRPERLAMLIRLACVRQQNGKWEVALTGVWREAAPEDAARLDEAMTKGRIGLMFLSGKAVWLVEP